MLSRRLQRIDVIQAALERSNHTSMSERRCRDPLGELHCENQSLLSLDHPQEHFLRLEDVEHMPSSETPHFPWFRASLWHVQKNSPPEDWQNEVQTLAVKRAAVLFEYAVRMFANPAVPRTLLMCECS